MEGSTRRILDAESKNILKIGHDSIHVSGVFEIPVTIAKLISNYDAFVALGCVIKGETPHFDLISKAVVNAIMDLSVRNKKPIGNGIITCQNIQQAIERADPNKKNKGGEAVSAVLQILANF
jgi:6,7-dimethyl-8-ribityllumazine synthase